MIYCVNSQQIRIAPAPPNTLRVACRRLKRFEEHHPRLRKRSGVPSLVFLSAIAQPSAPKQVMHTAGARA
jgi:hypothetical protein